MYSFDSKIRYSEVDSKGVLTFHSLLNYFQDVCSFHAEDAGVGIEYIREKELLWVLCAWQVEVEAMPKLGDQVTIGTIPYDFKGCMGNRNFFLQDAEGNMLSKANSVWMLLDTKTLKPTKMPEGMLERYNPSPKLEMEYAPRKIDLPDIFETKEIVEIKKYHLDTNQHVNNGRYIDMALEYLPDGFKVKGMRAEYKNQAYLGDRIEPKISHLEDRFVVVLQKEGGEICCIVEFTK